jgi:hypothetical protein
MSVVDDDFYIRNQDAPRPLDPDDQAHAVLVRDWNETFRTTLNNWVDGIFFAHFPNAPRKLDPGDPEHATMIEYWKDIRDAIRDGTPSRWNWTAWMDEADYAAAMNAAAAPVDIDAAAQPDPAQGTPDVQMDESEVKAALHHLLHGAHYIGDSAEILGLFARAAGVSAHARVILLAEVLGPIGMVASTVIVLWEVVRAFGTGERLQEQQGFCYGVMWQVTGRPDGTKNFIDWGTDSEKDLREAFWEGVAAGREKASEVEVHNKIMMAIAYHQLNGLDLNEAETKVLTDMWLEIRENDHASDWLNWPNPTSMQY